MSRVLVHKGKAEALDIRFEQAVERVEVKEKAKPVMARFLFNIITDDRNIRNAFESLCDKPRSSHEAGVWTKLGRHFFDKSKKYSDQLRRGAYRRRPERIREVSKPSGGTRQIVVQSPLDRVVDKACARILGPALDSTFHDNSWAYRPDRGCWHAIQRARALIKQGFDHWVSCDVRDAFGSVSLPRLIEVLSSRLPDDDLNELISDRLSGSPVKGLRQGSPLSALMLNLYLDNMLDRPWRRSHPDCPLIRYADDILIACRNQQEASKCYRALVDQLRPHGMRLKESEEQAIIKIRQKPVPYLGFLLSVEDGKTTARIDPRSFYDLRSKLEEAQRENRERDLQSSVLRWINYFGPAYRWHDRSAVYHQVTEQFLALGRSAQLPSESKFKAEWKYGHSQYRKINLKLARVLS